MISSLLNITNFIGARGSTLQLQAEIFTQQITHNKKLGKMPSLRQILKFSFQHKL